MKFLSSFVCQIESCSGSMDDRLSFVGTQRRFESLEQSHVRKVDANISRRHGMSSSAAYRLLLYTYVTYVVYGSFQGTQRVFLSFFSSVADAKPSHLGSFAC